MNWKRAAVIGLVALLVLTGAVVAGVSLYTDHLYRDSYDSTYTYEFSFAANQTLDDVTIYAPVPVTDGAVAVVGANVSTNSWDETTPANAPPVDASIVQTEHGPMLALTTESFPVQTKYYRFVEQDGMGERVEISEEEYEPGNPEMVAYTERSVRVEVMVAADHSIDTRNPTGVEPLLSPEFSRQFVPCEDAHFDTQECYSTTTRTFVSYEAPDETRTSVWVTLEGRNEWWIFGWNGNQYRHHYDGEFVGTQDSWHELEGALETGWGNYRGNPPSRANTTN